MATKLVGIGQMEISNSADDVLSAINLGSCLGISVYDPVAKCGGLIHCMLPISKSNPEKAKEQPCLYVDSGLTLLLQKIITMGGSKQRLIVAVAGGSNINDEKNYFEVGKKNYTVMKKLLWQNSILIKAEDVGGAIPRTITLNLSDGSVWLKANSENKQML